MALPQAHRKILLAAVGHTQDGALVEFDESGMFEFQTRFAPGRGDRALARDRHRRKEIMQVQLNRTDGLLQQHHHHVDKRQLATTGEVFVAGAMTLAEGFIMNQFARGLDGRFRGTV